MPSTGQTLGGRRVWRSLPLPPTFQIKWQQNGIEPTAPPHEAVDQPTAINSCTNNDYRLSLQKIAQAIKQLYDTVHKSMMKYNGVL